VCIIQSQQEFEKPPLVTRDVRRARKARIVAGKCIVELDEHGKGG
jgi:hypothetical protein